MGSRDFTEVGWGFCSIEGTCPLVFCAPANSQPGIPVHNKRAPGVHRMKPPPIFGGTSTFM